VSMVDGPFHTVSYNLVKLRCGDPYLALAAETGWDHIEYRIDQLGKDRSNFLFGKIGSYKTHAAIDVVTDTARTDQALIIIRGSHPPNRETISLMSIGHCYAVLVNTVKVRDIDAFLNRHVSTHLRNHARVRLNHDRDFQP